MNCTEFEAAVERSVETRESLASAALDHAMTCAECRRVWELHQRLDAALGAWRSATPSTGFVDIVLSKVANPVVGDDFDDDATVANHSDVFKYETIDPVILSVPVRSNVRIGGRSSVFAVGAVAVCLVVAAIFATQYSEREFLTARRMPSVRLPSDQIARTREFGARLEVSKRLTAVLSDLRLEYREMASETSSVAREMVNTIPDPMSLLVRPDTDEIKRRLDSSDLARIWLPIGSRVESALGFLWQAVPSDVPSG